MHCLVTGGAGFIGSHLVDSLLGAGHKVTVLDDLSTGSRSNLAPHLESGAVTFLQGSVLDEALVGRAVARADLVFHLAAAVGVDMVVRSPVRTIITNVEGTHAVLSACANEGGGTPILITSTSEVYGKSTHPSFAEDDDLVLGPTIRSRWSYAASKAVDEYLAFAYHQEQGLPVYIVRLFNTVGPRQTGQYGMVIPRFVQQALAGEPISVYGDGEQTRCFVHVQDVVPTLIELTTNRTHLVGQVFNLGSDREMTINELAREVIRVTGSTSTISHCPYDQAYATGFEDMRRRRPDLDRARTQLGFDPATSLEDIIRDVAESLNQKDHHGAPPCQPGSPSTG